MDSGTSSWATNLLQLLLNCHFESLECVEPRGRVALANNVHRAFSLTLCPWKAAGFLSYLSYFVFISSSYFARYELPNLQVDKIDKLMILVIHNIEGPWL